jgi:ubiquinone biosynthesis protein COQ4
VLGLANPKRTDMVAVLGETTGYLALRRMHRRMQQNPIGREILALKPRVNEDTVNLAALRYAAVPTSRERRCAA